MSATPIEAVKLSRKIKAFPSYPQSFKAGVLSYSNAGTTSFWKKVMEGLFSCDILTKYTVVSFEKC